MNKFNWSMVFLLSFASLSCSNSREIESLTPREQEAIIRRDFDHCKTIYMGYMKKMEKFDCNEAVSKKIYSDSRWTLSALEDHVKNHQELLEKYPFLKDEVEPINFDFLLE